MREKNARNLHRILALNLGLFVLVIGSVVAIQVWRGLSTVSDARADKEDKVCICHAAGLAGTTHFVTVCASRNAIFGQAGHFYEDGTPRAGHEEDYLGECKPEPSPSPSPSPSQSPSPSPGLN
jgi:hypothetical protein